MKVGHHEIDLWGLNGICRRTTVNDQHICHFRRCIIRPITRKMSTVNTSIRLALNSVFQHETAVSNLGHTVWYDWQTFSFMITSNTKSICLQKPTSCSSQCCKLHGYSCFTAYFLTVFLLKTRFQSFRKGAWRSRKIQKLIRFRKMLRKSVTKFWSFWLRATYPDRVQFQYLFYFRFHFS